MLPLNHLLYLDPDEGLSTAACREAAYLAQATGATLHLAPFVPPGPDAVRSAVQEETASEEIPSLRVVDFPSAPDALVDAVVQYVRAEDVELLVTDTPADRGPVPPLAVPWMQSLLRRLECSVLVTGHDTPLHGLERLLVPTDLTAPATTAFEHAAVLSANSTATIDLLHVIETDPYVALTRTDRLSLSATSFPERRARRRLTSFLDVHAVPNVAVESHVAYGEPADQIARFVNRHEVDLMVLSAPSGSAASTPSLGSVADRVLRRVTCPVLLVRPDARLQPNLPKVPDGPDASSM